ncbi:MAG TPA: hypothetical protein VFK06_09800, partial [Candidatus Angelobacter sp.]|nr:hypothetical protein [Candidatus Angelobacter sp.]
KERTKWFVRLSVPSAAILLPAAFFLSVLSPAAKEPNGLIYFPMRVGLFGGGSAYAGRRIDQEQSGSVVGPEKFSGDSL